LKVLDRREQSKVVYAVKHDYTPAKTMNTNGGHQTAYPRKSWSSFMLFNNAHLQVKAFTPEVVDRERPALLHRFGWVSNDDLINELPPTWNFVEGAYPKHDQKPNAIHATNGGPWFSNKQNVDCADHWYGERDRYLATGLRIGPKTRTPFRSASDSERRAEGAVQNPRTCSS